MLVGAPCLDADVAATIAPDQVRVDRRFLLLMALIVSVVQGELSHSGKVRLDAVEPRCAGRGPVEPDLVSSRVVHDFGFAVKAGVIQDDMQHAAMAVVATDHLQELEEDTPILFIDEVADQSVSFQIVNTVHLPDPTMTVVGGSDAIRMPTSAPDADHVAVAGSEDRTRRCKVGFHQTGVCRKDAGFCGILARIQDRSTTSRSSCAASESCDYAATAAVVPEKSKR